MTQMDEEKEQLRRLIIVGEAGVLAPIIWYLTGLVWTTGFCCGVAFIMFLVWIEHFFRGDTP